MSKPGATWTDALRPQSAAGPTGGGRSSFLLWLWAAGFAGIYTLTLRPSIGWYDTPEFPDVVHTLGIPHPPGSPTYVLFGKLATLIPLGGIAARLNLLSAFCAIGALVLLVASVSVIRHRLGLGQQEARLGGILCGTALAVAPTFWAYATQAEVYAPFALIVAALLYLALRWDATGDDRFLLAGAFLFGLSGGVHGTSLFFGPALALFVLTGMPPRELPARLGRAVLFVVLGASVYLYLPIRAGTEPPINWGDPDTLVRFWNHVSDRKDAAFHFPGASKPWWPYVRQFALNLNTEVTPAGWLAAIIGLGAMLVRAPRLAVFTILFCLGNLLFFIRIWTIPDGFMPTFVLVMFWAGLGLAVLFGSMLAGRRWSRAPVAALFLVFIAIQAHDGAIRAAARATDAARFAVEENLLPLPENTLVFATASWFTLRYLQDVEGMRPDVTIVLHSDLTQPAHFNPVTQDRFPRLTVPEASTQGMTWDDFFKALLRENLGKMPVYWEPLHELDRNVYAYLHPWRYLWRFDPEGRQEISSEEVEAYLDDLRAYLGRALHGTGALDAARPMGSRLPPGDDVETLRYHAYLLDVSADLLKLQGHPDKSITLLELGGQLTPDNPIIANDLARYYSGMRMYGEAERMFRLATALAPGDPTGLVNLAAMQISLGRYREGRRTIADALMIDPNAAAAHYQLYSLEQAEGHDEDARRALRRALATVQDRKLAAAWGRELKLLEAERNESISRASRDGSARNGRIALQGHAAESASGLTAMPGRVKFEAAGDDKSAAGGPGISD